MKCVLYFLSKIIQFLLFADLPVMHICNRKEIKDTRSWDSGTESHSAADDFFSVTSMLLPYFGGKVFLVLAIH